MKTMTIILLLALISVIGTASAANLYIPVPTTTPAQSGHVWVNVRCQHNLFSQQMILTSFTNNAAKDVYLSADGKWDDDLVPGDYALILLDGNAGHREYRFFTIRSAESVTFQFVGHAVTFGPGEENVTPVPTPTPIPTITPTPTASPTPVPTTVPTPVPTAIPTPVPTPICHTEISCTPGWWGPWIPGLWLNTWHPQVCVPIMVCE